ncbi:MAG: aminopeptidase P family protein [Rhodospirillaceae bacterium]|nr:aminopeptidase P family protein [Rhodospirillaceae bacterium]
MAAYAKPEHGLEPRLAAILDAGYPRFSRAELQRRRTLMAKAMEAAGVDHLVAHAAFFRGGPVHWLSDWLTTYEAALVFTPGRRDTIFVQFYNHLPQAGATMPDADMRWGGASTMQSVVAELKARGAAANRVGAVGMLPMGHYKALGAAFGDVADLNPAYARLRMVKSAEEIDWYRIAARLSDLSIDALRRNIRPGLDERDLGAITEAAYTPWRAGNIIHFFSSTAMRAPDAFVPRQHLTTRRIAAGDVISCEITASFWEHWGQVLRTFSVGEDLTPEYRRLHDTAERAYDAILNVMKAGVNARELAIGARVIEEAGFTFFDDLVHGFGGGYFPPIIGSPTRGEEALPDFPLQAGMTIVVQPNVITKDRRAGIQTGELVLVTKTGAETLHTVPRGAYRVGG